MPFNISGIIFIHRAVLPVYRKYAEYSTLESIGIIIYYIYVDIFSDLCIN